ncbi:conserved hypothetical protein [metagenome]|uniref:Uncharacterized protein n=1 Tax=metagenome TaxID=256318 RepID=A0A2P2BY53_9ZZZZ
MADKSPRQGMTKKSGKSLKEKRADKRGKSEQTNTLADTVAAKRKK